MNENVFTVTLIIVEIIFTLMVLKSLSNAGAKKPMLVVIALVFMAWLITDYMLDFLVAQGCNKLPLRPLLLFPL